MKRYSSSVGRILFSGAVLAVVLGAVQAGWALRSTTQPASGPDEGRVRAIEAMLPETPAGMGWPISDRAAWKRLAALPEFAKEVANAQKLLDHPPRPTSEDLYLEYSKIGDRSRYQKVEGDLRDRLTTLVFAECIENKGRFLPAIEQLIDLLCAERTWMLPAHDGSLANYNGKTIDIDLWSSRLAWQLATADGLLGDKLSRATRQKLRDNIRTRVLDPYMAMVTGQRPANWWLRGTNNWNAVCLAGVTGAAMEQVASRRQRAEFVAAAEKFSKYYLKGFESDGYCSEGLGYWNYGFGHYVMLAEIVRQATNGQVDLLGDPLVREIARFGSKIEILGGVAPAFADCAVDARPDARIERYVNLRLGLHEPVLTPNSRGDLAGGMVYCWAFASADPAANPTSAPAPDLRTWFDKAGILICRPAAGSACRLGVAIKGGSNAENHNHNDVGSFVVVMANRAVLLDPGAEKYTARTFSKHRYESNLLNSFGHPVPKVAGQLQQTGPKASAKILETEFTDSADRLVMDIRSAYGVAALQSLTRSFMYSRRGKGKLVVTDEATFTSPQMFGTALLTAGVWKRQGENTLLIQDKNSALRVTIDTGGEPFTITASEIREDAKVHPTRIGIDLVKPVASAKIVLKIEP